MITIIAVGKRHEPWLVPGIARYEQRLRGNWQIHWKHLPSSKRSGNTARQDESLQIMRHIKPTDYVVLLDERGTIFDSPTLAELVQQQLLVAKSIIFVIGGAYGVDNTITQRANTVWSLSKLVFPHQLIRLLLIEQLYRCQQITNKHPYHHI